MTCPNCATPVVPGAAFCRGCGTALTATSHASAPAGPAAAREITVSADMVGRTCPYCRFPLKQDGHAVECGSCHAVQHSDCYAENRGCAVNGCAGAPGAQPTQSMPTAAPLGVGAPTLSVPPPPSAAGMTASPPPPAMPTVPMGGIPSPLSVKAPGARPRGNRAKGVLIALGVVLALSGAGAAVVVAMSDKTTHVTTVTQAAATDSSSSSDFPSSDGAGATEGDSSSSGYTDTGGDTSTPDDTTTDSSP